MKQGRQISQRQKGTPQVFWTFSSCHSLPRAAVMLRSQESMAAGTGAMRGTLGQAVMCSCHAETVLKAEPGVRGDGEGKSLTLNLNLIWGFVWSQL